MTKRIHTRFILMSPNGLILHVAEYDPSQWKNGEKSVLAAYKRRNKNIIAENPGSTIKMEKVEA